MKLYYYGHNVPGYLPESMDGCDPLPFEEAKQALIDELLLHADQADDPEPSEAGSNLDNAAQDVTLWSGPDSIVVDDGTPLGRVYWVMDAEEKEVNAACPFCDWEHFDRAGHMANRDVYRCCRCGENFVLEED